MAQVAAGDKADFYNAQRPLLAFLARLDEEKLKIAPDIYTVRQRLDDCIGRRDLLLAAGRAGRYGKGKSASDERN